MKIIDKINAKIADKTPFFSFEFFPPKTQEGVENLFEKQEDLSLYGPVFCDITWGAGGSTADVTLEIAHKMQNLVCVETMMHLTCTNMSVERLDTALKQAKDAGLHNILALRGDPPKGQEKFEAVEGGYSCALDLVKYIRKEYGDYFGIGVAGYPEAHPDAIVEDKAQMKENYWKDIAYLKEKVLAGGDFIITQLFYDVDGFLQFVKDCRSVGITCPIVPGIMPIMTYGGFTRMTGFCKTRIPESIATALESIKDNEEAVKAYGIHQGVEMCKRILEAGTPGIHMYTLNQGKAVLRILEELGFIQSPPPRTLPWLRVGTAGTQREAVENVRPIFWQNRPKSYACRTSHWGSFPKGRWSGADQQTYQLPSGSLSMLQHTCTELRKKKSLAAWGAELEGVEDVIKAFVRFYSKEIAALPWSEFSELQNHSKAISEELVALSLRGYLPINSQPRVDGALSDDAMFGWGPTGGHIYQKGYLEFFCAPEAFEQLLTTIQAAPSIKYFAASRNGELQTNLGSEQVDALSWAVYPGQELVQPAIADSNSFLAWRTEAFELWMSDWGCIYAEDSKSREVIAGIQDSWMLVSLIDEDYVSGDIFALFQTAEEVDEEVEELLAAEV